MRAYGISDWGSRKCGFQVVAWGHVCRLRLVCAILLAVASTAMGAELDSLGQISFEGDIVTGVVVQGDYAYLSVYAAGLKVVDITDPSTPTVAGSLAVPGGAMDVAVAGDLALVGRYDNVVSLIDVSDPATPAQIDEVGVPGRVMKVCIHDGYGYAAMTENGVAVVDLASSPLDTISWITQADRNSASDLAAQGDYLFAVGGHDQQLRMVNVTDPALPVITAALDGDFSGVSVRGNYAYFNTTPENFDNWFYVYDISDTTDLIARDSCQLTTVPDQHSSHSMLWRNLVVIACEGTGIEVIDISDPDNVVHRGQYSVASDVEDVWLDDDFVYVATLNEGFKIFANDLPCCFGMRGNIDADDEDKVNISDMTFLTNYLFSGGQEPFCTLEADVNGDGPININDMTYLVGYLFSGGPAPAMCP